MTHGRSEFPQYYHVEDLYGNVFALVCMETPKKMVVIQKREQRKSFFVSTVSTEEEVKALAPGQMLGASPQDYSDVLNKEWGFSLSPDVLCDRLGEGDTANVGTEKSVTADEPVTEEVDVQGTEGTDGGDSAPTRGGSRRTVPAATGGEPSPR